MDIENQSLSAPLAYHLVSDYLEKPTRFQSMIDQWPCRTWTLVDWGVKLKNQTIQFRVGKKSENKVDPIWEGECEYVEGTIDEFSSWLHDWPNIPAENVFKKLNPHEVWCYADYKYMAQLFMDDSDTLEAINWGVFGFNGRNGKESTLWIGSAGAHTPCHYDTYGYNLVAQLYGKKRWVLFPPSQSEHLQPTRIPYEESSVFSKVNISNPQLDIYPDFQNTTPYVICLKPGDVLFVPRHWWHYVESLETAISVNTWIEMDEDDDSRLQEAIVKFLITTLAPITNVQQWLNPTEELTSVDENLMFIQMSLRKLKENQSSAASRLLLENSDEKLSLPKRVRLLSKEKKMKMCMNDVLIKYKEYVIPIEPIQFDCYYNMLKIQPNTQQQTSCKGETDKSNFSQLFLNCLVNPSVVNAVGNLLKKKIDIVNNKST